MAYIGWDNQEYEDSEMDNMRRDRIESEQEQEHVGQVMYPALQPGRPIRVHILNERAGALLSFANIVDLLGLLTPDEQQELVTDFQSIINYWCERKASEL
jgi:hypothetical protein